MNFHNSFAYMLVSSLPGLLLMILGIYVLEKHDWKNGFLKDRYGVLGIAYFLIAAILFLISLYYLFGYNIAPYLSQILS
jgi:hypothetical protein